MACFTCSKWWKGACGYFFCFLHCHFAFSFLYFLSSTYSPVTFVPFTGKWHTIIRFDLSLTFITVRANSAEKRLWSLMQIVSNLPEMKCQNLFSGKNKNISKCHLKHQGGQVVSASNFREVVGWCKGVVYLKSPGRPADIGLQLGKTCYPHSR